ncbi:MAG: LacI family transcriptional regulator, partial [Alphaproteobacteria bacterium]
GVIFVGQGRHRSEIRDFARAHKRVVTWGAVEAADDHCVVGSDNVGGGMLATQHMLNLGRKAVAFLGDRTLPEIGQRYEGYALALTAAGMDVDERRVIAAPFDIKEARVAAQPLAALYPEFDAIFAASDMIALAAIAALRDKGIRVPRDVSVVGFDDIPAGAHVSPSLTTVHQDIRRAGEILVEKLIAILAGESVSSQTIETRLIVRQSCGARP